MRTYVGARYVTKIYENSNDPSSAEWEASVNYEPLVMVTYNYGSYLSKKEVPASVGNPADNPSYWTQTGFYNGQIMQLQTQVAALNAITAKLDDPFYIMVSTGDTTDRSAELIAALADKKAIIFSEGDFYFENEVTLPDDTKIIGCGASTVIHLSAGSTGYIFNSGNNVSIESIKFDGGLSARPNSIDNRGAIEFNTKSTILTVHDCKFIGFSGSAVYIKDVGYGHLASIECTDCYFRYNGAGIFFDHHGEYGLVTNCTFVDCYTGALIGGGNNQFQNCGFNRCYYGADLDGSISTNNGHGLITGCTFNHNLSIGLRLKDLTFGEAVTGCMFYIPTNADIEVDNSFGAAIKDCMFGNGAKISVHDGSVAFMINNTFTSTPASIGIDSASKVNGMANYTFDGARIAALCKTIPFGNETLAKAYTANTSVDETSFNNNRFEIIGGTIYAYINMNVTAAPSGFVEVGTFTKPTGYSIFDTWVMLTTNTGGIYLLGILNSGSIQIYTYNAGTGNLRTTIAIPVV